MAQWEGKTRGGLAGYRIFVFLIKNLGLSFAYFILRFVAVYFVLSSSAAYHAIYAYFRRIHGQSRIMAFANTYRNFCTFGTILVDKIAVLSDAKISYTYDFDGEHHLRGLCTNNTGGILINAHVGNWEIAGQLLERLETCINILMFDAEHDQIKQYLSDVLVRKKVNIIPIRDDLSHLNLIRQALANREIIAMNGDRFMPGNKTVVCNFMGKAAEFPVSPFYMAGKFGVPVVYAFAMKESKTHYHFYATPPRYVDHFGNLKTRNQTLAEMVQEYASHLGQMVRKYPYQWFNYYPFWKA